MTIKPRKLLRTLTTRIKDTNTHNNKKYRNNKNKNNNTNI